MWLCRTLLCLGVIVGIPSVWETLAFSWNPDFQAPRLPLGPTHTNYHAFREFTLTLGTELIMLYIIFLPLQHRIRPFWNVMLMQLWAITLDGGCPGRFLDITRLTRPRR